MLPGGCLGFPPEPRQHSLSHTLCAGLGLVGPPRAGKTLTTAPSVCSKKLSLPRNLPCLPACKNWVISYPPTALQTF